VTALVAHFRTSRFQFADLGLRKLLGALLAHAAQAEPLGKIFTQSLSFAIAERLVALEHLSRERAIARSFPPRLRRLIEECSRRTSTARRASRRWPR
jgi:hypothetical protein